jgi:ATP-dependent Clp protease adaptor protein ClpS
MARRPKEQDDTGVITEEKTRERVERPKLYKVLLHNDHYTTREFVVDVLVLIFNKSETEARQIMMHVHQKGTGVAGVYPFDVAHTKVDKVLRLAKEYEYPLLLTVEPEDD